MCSSVWEVLKDVLSSPACMKTEEEETCEAGSIWGDLGVGSQGTQEV